MLEHLFGSKTRVRLLRLFFRNSDQPFYVREMSRQINSQINAVRRELQNLQKAGVIKIIENPPEDSVTETNASNRCTWYQLDKEYSLHEEIKALVMKSRVLDEQALADEIVKVANNVHTLLFTGCFVGTEEAPVDLLVVGSVDKTKFNRLLKKYEKEIGSVIRYTILSTKEFQERQQVVDRFLYSIYQNPHLIVTP